MFENPFKTSGVRENPEKKKLPAELEMPKGPGRWTESPSKEELEAALRAREKALEEKDQRVAKERKEREEAERISRLWVAEEPKRIQPHEITEKAEQGAREAMEKYKRLS